MRESGFYKLEDESYLYVFGGKIQVSGIINIGKQYVSLSVAESEKKASIGTALDLDKDYSIKDKPKTFFRFYNEESIQGFINELENLKLKLREIKNK